jgi:hypothetical protein
MALARGMGHDLDQSSLLTSAGDGVVRLRRAHGARAGERTQQGPSTQLDSHRVATTQRQPAMNRSGVNSKTAKGARRQSRDVKDSQGDQEVLSRTEGP